MKREDGGKSQLFLFRKQKMFQTCELNVDFITEGLGSMDELNGRIIETHQNQNNIQYIPNFIQL